RRDLESQGSVNGTSTRQKLWWMLLLDAPLLLTVLLLLSLFELGVLPSHKAGFYCNDPALSFPFTGDTVSTSVLLSTVFTAPLIVKLPLRADIQLSVVELMKGITGSPRPTFFDICQPDTGKTCTGSEFVSTFECTSTKFSNWMKTDSYHSFPSGHTSLSVYCGLFIAWYVQKRAFNWRSRSVFVVPATQLLSLSFAAVSSLTRVTDRRHHWWDVTVGCIVGAATFYYAGVVLSKNFLTLRREHQGLRLQVPVKGNYYDKRTTEAISP
ncbi:hypothetical protein ACJJTC_009769, partial [Scirpophaga incertulas]